MSGSHSLYEKDTVDGFGPAVPREPALAQTALNTRERINRSRGRYRYSGAAAAVIAILPAVASAQSAPSDRIEAIEQQIRKMQAELKDLKGQLGQAREQLRQSRGEAQRSRQQAIQAQQAADQARYDAARAAASQSQATQAAAKAQAVAAAPPPAAAGTLVSGINVTMPGGRPTISTSDGRASFAIGAQVQFDMGGYFQNPGRNTQFPNLNNGVNLRRARIFFVGKYDDFTLNLTPDFGGSPDGSPTLYEANLNWSGYKPVTATIGYFKPWFSLYDSQSSNDFLQMERPSIIEIARNLAAGDTRASVGAAAAWNQLFLSGYLTGAAYGANSGNNLGGEQLGFVGRVAGRPYYDKDWNFYVGMSGEDVFHPNIVNNTIPSETITLSDRPELRIDNNRLINTNAIPATGANSFGGGVGASWRNLIVQGEYYRINVDQAQPCCGPNPVLGFNGGYVEGGWVITGEPIRYSVASASFARPKVANPFSFNPASWGGGIGAWELSARYSATNLTTNTIPGVSQTVTGGVNGGFQQVAGVLVSWYPNDWVRLYLQGQYTNVNKLNTAGTAQIGQHFYTLEGRWQLAF